MTACRSAPRAFAWAALGALAGSMSGCVTTERSLARSPSSILVRNETSRDAVVYVVQNGYSMRLGRVVSHGVERLPILQPLAALGPLQVILRMSGSEPLTLEPIWLTPHRGAELTIAPLTSTSTLILR